MSAFSNLLRPKDTQPGKLRTMASRLHRKRNYFALIGSLIMVSLWLITDPDAGIITDMPFGAKVLDIFTVLSKGIIYVLLLHYCRKFILDRLDFQGHIERANDTPQGAGLAAIAIAIYTLAFSIVIYAATAASNFR